ncbi:cobyrinic acid a,c-diamide synthase [Salinisphaera sp. Q1T1-3]|uniref:cobyrinic acid a,c-diamide synthase n=1 Tax=Salinisphaera sp. Q1T1-3 TaxID=2321229 RepID=UPI000E75D405|nr:cobyrinic acid a,c-diamide synthase [Salinisphaera sp. Q1T1-3]RJS94912.1 cobyrinic acid a,c-diamide synthase [Salinisphaera sp. Q1T1-3]
MFGFLQGFAYGLFLSCLPWFLIGMLDPRLAVPTEPPTRWRAILRYWFGVPFVAFVLWLTSLWGGFSPSFLGWLTGLGALAVAVPAERWWHRLTRRRAHRRRRAITEAENRRARAEAERDAREAGLAELDPSRPPADADPVVHALCRAKQMLLDSERTDLAAQADRLYTRYRRVLDVLADKFDAREITFERSRAMVGQVGLSAADNLSAMGALAAGVVGIDTAYVRRRLAERSSRQVANERDALQQRLDLVADTERRLAELSAHNETAMTTLDNAVVVMSRVDTGRPQADVATDEALADLKRFMDKAERYGHTH